MATASCLCNSLISVKINGSGLTAMRPQQKLGMNQQSPFAFTSCSTELFGQQFNSVGGNFFSDWSFVGGSKVIVRPKLTTSFHYGEGSRIYASGLTSSQIASYAFTLGTVAVLPFYSLMVLAPKAKLTRKSIQSSIPYVVLGLLYAYLLYLSWTPDTIRLMFASQYWLPELPGIAKIFSNEMTLASAWIHLLAVDLFAARQVFLDGLENQIETRHSVSICLLFCPIGIIVHAITKKLTRSF